MDCPRYIQELFSELDKNTYIIQAHAEPPSIDSVPKSVHGYKLAPIRGINEVFFKIPDNVFIVFGTPYKHCLYAEDVVDENLITQLKRAGNKIVLSQNPDNYSRSDRFGLFLENLGLFCPGDMFFNFYIAFDDDINEFNIKKITKTEIISAYSGDRKIGLGRNLRKIVLDGKNYDDSDDNQFTLREIVDEISLASSGNPTIIYLTSCNVSPTSGDFKALHDLRGAYIREYDSRAAHILEKAYSNMELLREYEPTVKTRGRRKARIQQNVDVYDEQEDHSLLYISKIRGTDVRDKMRSSVDRVLSEFPFGWSNKDCVCIDQCKQKSEYSKLSNMAPDNKKYFCEVDLDCPDEETLEDGGRRYHRMARKNLAKCNGNK